MFNIINLNNSLVQSLLSTMTIVLSFNNEKKVPLISNKLSWPLELQSYEKAIFFINNNVKKIPHFYDLVEIIYNWVCIKHPVWYVGITTLFEKVCSLIRIAWNIWKFVQKSNTTVDIFCWSLLFEFSNKTSFSLAAWLLLY